jgi:N utilization substance protein B
MAMQMLFQEEQSGTAPEEVMELFWKSHRAETGTRELAERIFRAAVQEREAVDGMIRETARSWKLERMAAVDRCILRAAIAESLVIGTPKPVLIDEAIEIARKFGGEKSPEFVNGILDRVLTGPQRSEV